MDTEQVAQDVNVPILDLESLRMNIGNDPEFEKEFIELYIADTLERMQAIIDLIDAGNYADIRWQAHSIKGASANVHAARMNAVAYQLELASKNEQNDIISTVFEQMQQEYNTLKATYYTSEEQSESGASSINVLIIEDDRIDAQLLQKMLSESDEPRFNIMAIDNLTTGIALLNNNTVDIILLDLNLPDSRGIDTVIKTYSEFPLIPIAILTSLEDEDLAIEAIEQGAQDYIIKGQFTTESLVQSIQMALT